MRHISQKHQSAVSYNWKYKWIVTICLLSLTVASQADKGSFEVLDSSSSKLQISNGIAGEVCTDDGEPTHVCVPGETINVVGQEMCDWSKDVQYPCTRYGHEFNFSGGDPTQNITCKVARSIRTVFGEGTERVTGENTAEYDIPIRAESGRLFHDGFQTYAPVDSRVLVHESHTCYYDGKALYRVNFIHRFEPE